MPKRNSRTSDRARPRHPGLVRRQRARRRVVVRGDEGREVRLRERVRRRAGRVRPARDQRHRPGARTDPLYHAEENQEAFLVLSGECALIVERRRTTTAALGLLPVVAVDRARLRRRGRGAVRDPDGRSRTGPGVRYPVSEVAERHGASVAEETSDWRQAYARVERFRQRAAAELGGGCPGRSFSSAPRRHVNLNACQRRSCRAVLPLDVHQREDELADVGAVVDDLRRTRCLRRSRWRRR